MEQEIFVALLALLGSVIGTFSGIAVNTKLINYRLSALEAKMDRHNQAHGRVIDRICDLEKQDAVTQEELKIVNRRIGNLEGTRK